MKKKLWLNLKTLSAYKEFVWKCFNVFERREIIVQSVFSFHKITEDRNF